MENIQIFELRERPEFTETVIDWLYSEWGNNNPSFWSFWVKSSLCENDIPKTYILTVDALPVGTYSLWRCDLQSRQDLSPWLGGLYVCKKFRGKLFNGKKLGEIMQSHAFSELKKMNYKTAYLFTEKNPSYYIRNGWEYICDVPNETDHIVKICKINL